MYAGGERSGRITLATVTVETSSCSKPVVRSSDAPHPHHHHPDDACAAIEQCQMRFFSNTVSHSLNVAFK